MDGGMVCMCSGMGKSGRHKTGETDTRAHIREAASTGARIHSSPPPVWSKSVRMSHGCIIDLICGAEKFAREWITPKALSAPQLMIVIIIDKPVTSSY